MPKDGCCPTCGLRGPAYKLTVGPRAILVNGRVVSAEPQHVKIMKQLIRYNAGRTPDQLIAALKIKVGSKRRAKAIVQVRIAQLREMLEPDYNITSAVLPTRRYRLIKWTGREWV